MGDRAKTIFGNDISDRSYRKACKKKEKFKKRFGDDSTAEYKFKSEENEILSQKKKKNLVLTDGDSLEFDERAVIVTLTDEGRALREKALGVPSCIASCIS